MRRHVLIMLLLCSAAVRAQDSLAVKTEMPDFGAIDSLYREDQFYVGFTYDILTQRPESVQQNKFSAGISLGFLRDMPINKSRTWAIAAGVGFGIHSYNQNLGITKTAGNYHYAAIPDTIAYSKNKMVLDYLELPIEIRWRTSTPNSHKFWRVYTGLKLSYLVFSKYKYSNGGDRYALGNLSDLDKLQYGVYLATGYNTWNLNVYYGFNPLFKSGETDAGEELKMHSMNIGLMFYIL
jgi:hypothetical protein